MPFQGGSCADFYFKLANKSSIDAADLALLEQHQQQCACPCQQCRRLRNLCERLTEGGQFA